MKFKTKVLLTNFAVVVLFIADRILKIYFVNNPGARRVFVSNFLSFNLETNPGIAFGFNFPQVILLPIVVVVIVVLTYVAIDLYKEKDVLSYFSLILIIVGAISNLIDRFKYEVVIDYINIPFFTVFNLSDIMITLGVAILLIDRFRALAKSKS